VSAKTIDLSLIRETTETLKATMRRPAEVVMVGNTELLMDALVETRTALEAARHELATLHGLTATDGEHFAGWSLDMSGLLARIDAVLPTVPPEVAVPLTGQKDIPDDIADIIDAAWQMPPGAHERIRTRFLALLAEEEPDHPWVLRSRTTPPGDGAGGGETP
jgi:hypothetical protein